MESPQAIPAPLPSAAQPRELSRLAALLRYEILDTPEESAFDDFTALAAQMCDTPIALISLVDDRRQWFKSRVGLDVSETPRYISSCTYTLPGQHIFELPDALQDPRFRDNPLVQGDPHIRFYAGTPLTSPDGHNLGTLCVIDRKPRRLSSEQRETLERLGRQVIRLFEQHLLAHRHAEQAALQQAILDSASSAVLITRPDGIVTSVNPTAERLLGYSEQALAGHPLTTKRWSGAPSCSPANSRCRLKRDSQCSPRRCTLAAGRCPSGACATRAVPKCRCCWASPPSTMNRNSCVAT